MVNFASKVLAAKRFPLAVDDVAVAAEGVLISLVERLLAQLDKDNPAIIMMFSGANPAQVARQ